MRRAENDRNLEMADTTGDSEPARRRQLPACLQPRITALKLNLEFHSSNPHPHVEEFASFISFNQTQSAAESQTLHVQLSPKYRRRTLQSHPLFQQYHVSSNQKPFIRGTPQLYHA